MTSAEADAADRTAGARSWWSRPAGRVALLSVGTGLVTLALHALLLATGLTTVRLDRGIVPIWLLAAMFAATEGFAVHLRVRRGGHAMSLSEIPMVLGMLGTDPTAILLARVVGGGAGLALFRSQRGLKLGFNLALLGIQATSASMIFLLVAGDATELGPREWAAAYAAMFVTDFIAAVLVTAVIALHDDPGEWRRLGQAMRGIPLVAVTTTVSLVGAMAIHQDVRAVVLIIAVSLLTFAGYRAYIRQSQGHAQVEELYAFTRALDGSLDTQEVARIVLDQARDQMRAEVAELVVPGPGPGRPWSRMRMSGRGIVEISPVTDPGDAWWAAATEKPVLLSRKDRRDGPADGIAVPVPMPDAATGVLLVIDSLPDTPRFGDEHVKLFQALANHASVSLAKAGLVDRLRREVTEKEHLALHDPLTGLPNRRHFNQLLEATLDGAPAAVMLMDLDRFKEVNDALGHNTGDALLREVGTRLQRRLAGRGVVARLGGDEFAVLITGEHAEYEALSAADELARDIEIPVVVDHLTLNTRASIGIALAPEHGSDAATLLQRADVAMYAAKETRTGARVYHQEDDQNTPHRLALIGDLRGAIQHRDLLVMFQPKLDPVTGLVTGAEALARWHHPDQGYIGPDEFIPLAEHSGLIRPLTLHVLEVSLRRCAGWRRRGHDIHVAVNLSPNTLLDDNLPEIVARLLGQTGVPARALTLEITESSIMADPTGSMRTLDRLNALGVKLAIDDFGTGYSSLGRLRELPIHEVKIDKSFVQRIAVDHRDRAVVRSAVQLGHALDLEVVAEGVEDSETYNHLTREGANVIQGYYVSRPLPGDEFLSWLEARRPLGVTPGPGH